MRSYRYIATLLFSPCLLLAETSRANDRVQYCIQDVFPQIEFWQGQVDTQNLNIEVFAYDIEKGYIDYIHETTILSCGNDNNCVELENTAYDASIRALDFQRDGLNSMLEYYQEQLDYWTQVKESSHCDNIT